MTYKIGTRVKKVRGIQQGITGVVTYGPNVVGQMPSGDCDMCVRQDAAWVSDLGTRFPAGSVSNTVSANWEPIIPDGHRPAEQGSFEPLDHLLSRLKGVEA